MLTTLMTTEAFSHKSFLIKLQTEKILPLRAEPALVLYPAHARLPARNGLVNEVEFLGLITQNG